MRTSAWLRWLNSLLTSRPNHLAPSASRRGRVVPRVEALEDRCLLTVTYGGGPLLTSVQVQALYYGNQWGTNPTLQAQRTYLDGYLQYLVSGPYLNMLSNAGYGVGPGSSTAGALDNLPLASSRDDSQIQTDLTTAINASQVQNPGGVSNNHLYVVFVEPNVQVTLDGSNSTFDFAGYHNTFTASVGGQTDNIYYAVIAYPGGANYGAFGLPNDPINSLTEVTSHEVAEACTDPNVSTGWADFNTGDEIGDVVNGQATSLNGYIVQKEASKSENALIPAGALDLNVASLQLSSAATSVNQSLTLTASINNYADVYGTQTNPNPFTGTVDFYDGGTLLGSGGLQSVGGVMTATFTTAGLGAGPHSLKAVYEGDQHFLSSTSSTMAETVKQISSATQVSVPSSASPSQPVVFTATVAPGASGPVLPGGQVNFYIDGSAAPQGSGALQLVNGVETATFSATLGPGAHTVQAIYQGDADFTSSPSSSVAFTLGLATTTAVTSNASTATFGQTLTFTATVTNPSGGAAPTGSVQFFDGANLLGAGTAGVGGANSAVWTFTTSALSIGGHAIKAVYTATGQFAGSSGTTAETIDAVTATAVVSNPSPSTFGQSVTFTTTVTNASTGATPTGAVEFFDGAADLGAGTAGAGGVWTFTTSALSVGVHSIKAVYAPTGTFVGSNGTATQAVDAVTTTGVASGGNPAMFGQPVTLTATVANTSTAATPTGAVEFFDGAADLGAGAAGAGGVWTFTTSALSVGIHSVKTVYTPTGLFAGSSGATAETIDAVTATGVVSNPSPSTFGQLVTFTATVTNASTGATPTGAVEFFDGAADLGAGVGGGGVWTFTTSALSIGGHAIKAVYAPTGLFAASSGTAMQTIDAVTAAAVASTLGPSTVGQSVTFTATVTNASTGATPTGAVEFFDGAADLGAGAVVGAGAWTFTTSSLAFGVHSIKAIYTPTGAFAKSSGALKQTVDAATITAVLHSDGSLDLLGPAGLQPLSAAGSIKAVSSVTDASGNNDVFAIIQTPGYVGTAWEYSPAFGGWKEISSGVFQQISAATNAAGQAVVFGILSDNSLWEQNPGGIGLDAGWRPLSPGGSMQSISAVTDRAGDDVVFAAVRTPGYVGTVWEHSPAFDGGWREISSGSFQQISAGLNAAGQAIVFGVLIDGELWEQDPALGTGLDVGWTRVGTGTVQGVAASGTPGAAFMIDSNQHLEQFTPGASLSLLSIGTFASLSTAVDAAGVDELFAVLTDGSFYEYALGFPGSHFEQLLTSGVIAVSASARHAG